jgi:hypothetical protein
LVSAQEGRMILAWHFEFHSNQFPDCIWFALFMLAVMSCIIRGAEPLAEPLVKDGHMFAACCMIAIGMPMFLAAGMIFYANDFLRWCFGK